MRRAFLFSVLTLTASALVADGSDMVIANSGAPSARVNGQQQSMTSSMTLASGRPVASSGWLLSVEPLYWYTSVSGESAPYTKSTTAAPLTTKSFGNRDFPWAWGVRAAVGINMGCDQWDSQLLYTGFWPDNNWEETATGHIVENVEKRVTTAYDNFQSARSISFNMFDWQLGKWFLFSKKIRARPHVGIKGGWVNQKVANSFTVTKKTLSTDSSSNFAGIGTEGGFRTKWNLSSGDGHSFSLLGDLSAALMYGHWSNRQTSKSNDSSATAPVDSNASYNGINSSGLAVMASAEFGFGWDVAIDDGDSNFNVDLTYQFQYWPSLSQLNAASSAPADLGFQGLGLKLGFDF